MQTIGFNFTNMPHVVAGNFSAKPHGRFRCHIWIQYGSCITIFTFLIYVHSMFHLHPCLPHVLCHEARMANAKQTGEVKDVKQLCRVKCFTGLFKIVL